jgi:hypothetical protein
MRWLQRSLRSKIASLGKSLDALKSRVEEFEGKHSDRRFG